MTEPRLLGGRYELGEMLGRGGMAEVRRAKDTRLGREVAIKQLRIDLASDSTFLARFRREAQSAAGLNHPNIVSVYDTGEEVDPTTGIHVPYIVMELVRGHTLRELIRGGRKILPTKALEFTQGVLDALSYSHKMGIVHRDIKPANVMLTESGQIKVMDFGIARAVADTSATMTQTAAVIGTAQYLSPEQARGETVDARSDIYSTGCLLYELLTGRPPFQGDSPVSVAYQHVREAPVAPSHVDSMATPAMDAVTLKALAKDPAHRYQTAASMHADIARLLAGQAVQAQTMPRTTPPPTSANAPTQVLSGTSLAAAAAATQIVEPDNPVTSTGRIATRAIEPVRRPRRVVWIWGVVLGTLALAGIVAGFLIFNPLKPSTVSVPLVVNRPQEDAVSTLKSANLVPAIKTVEGPADSTVGLVTDQDPKSGTAVAPGSTVTITVNVGPKKIQVPANLVGLSKTEVEQALATAGFTNVKSTPATTEPATAVADQVLTITPPSGTTVTPDTAIEFTYATGTAIMPNVMTLNKDQAVAQLQELGITKVNLIPRPSAAEADTVVDQKPAQSTVVKKTDIVTIYYAVTLPTSAPPTTAPPTSTLPTSPAASPSSSGTP